MILEGDTLIPAERREVWKALNDPDVLRDCIPGCKSLERRSDTDFTASVRAAIGPVSATFGAEIALGEIEPDRGYTITGEGKGGAAGFARGNARVDLEDEGEGTRLRYRADVRVGGKLAQLGSRLIEGTARKLAEEFFTCLSERLGGDAPRVATIAPEGAAPSAGTPDRRLIWIGLIVVAAMIGLALWIGA